MDFPLFVYGTLQRGFSAHVQLCAGARLLGRARTRGTLYEHADGYPVLAVAPGQVLGLGTRDAFADAREAATRRRRPAALSRMTYGAVARLLARTAPAAGTIEGEILAFRPSRARLATLDLYEGYQWGHPSLFVRVLLDVEAKARRPARAWAYVAGALMPAAMLTPWGAARWRPHLRK